MAARVGRRDEEVEQLGLAARAGDEQVAARAEPREQGLGDERGEDGGERGVDRVAPVAQDIRPRLRGDRMPGGDDALQEGTRLRSGG